MSKIIKYEYVLLNFTWIFILIYAIRIVIFDFYFAYDVTGNDINCKLSSLVLYTVYNVCKLFVIRKNLFESDKFYYGSRIIEPIMVSFTIFFGDFATISYIVLFFMILVTAIEKGRRITFALVGYSMFAASLLHLITFFISNRNWNYSDIIFSPKYIYLIMIHIVLLMFAQLCSSIYFDTMDREKENKKLYMEVATRYEQLSAAQDEIKVHNDKLKETNEKIEETNKKLRESIAEFFTVQQITQAISSIFDVKDLLQHVNDIIIGVMGVNNSTIILYDEKVDKLKVHTTNITTNEELVILNDNINCAILMDVINRGEPILENFADTKEYPFTEGREISSLICIPLVTKSRKFGIVLLEHRYYNAFDNDNLRLLNIIGQQVGIAMENAELYQKMHELATIDSLTGVYNRLYFQERLNKEFESAKSQKYCLCLAIFDIDHFKRFNDTFGHLFGDKVLKHIADTIKNALRQGDIVARFGGEEFVILLPKTDIDEAFKKVERLRQLIESTTIKDELVSASVTASFGLSSYPDISITEGELLRTADNALYEAKESGRNCVKIAK